MRKANWFAGGAIVFVILAIALTFDPLGFFETGEDIPQQTVLDDDPLTSAGLKGRGTRPLPDADPKTWEGEPVGTLVLTLGKATLTGKVTGEGEPLRFARVHPVLPPPNDAVAVRTRKDGTWEIRGLPAGQHELRASATDFVSRTTIAPAVAEDGSATCETIDLQRRTDERNTIQVKVTDAFGRPLPGAKVLATTMPWDLHLAMGPEVAGIPSVKHSSGTTDETGTVRLGPLPAEKYAVVATAPGFIAGSVNDLVVSGGRMRAVGLKLNEGVSVSGRVVDRDGAGVEGALVMGMAQPSWVSSTTVRTTADGSFVLDGLRKSAYIFIGWHEQGGQTTTRAAAPGTVRLNLEGTGHVKGQVLWSDGTPVTSGMVRPFQNGPFQYVYSMVEKLKPDGTFEMDLPKGTWTFRIQSGDGHMVDSSGTALEVGGTATLKIELPKTGIARGVVMDESGQHIAGAEVFVMKGGFPETPSREQYARTDAEGRFEVHGLPLETIGLYVQHTEHQDTKIEVMPSAPAEAKEISVRLKRGASVVGRIIDASGSPLVGEQVNLAAGWFDVRSTYTDAEGRYRIDAVTPGSYSVTTGPYEAGARGLRKSGINVGDEGEVVVDFEVPAAGGRLGGVVQLGGKPLPGARVTIVDDRGAEKAVNVTSDESGRFLAEGLQYGSVRVTARTAQGLSGSARGTVVEGDAPAEVTVDIGTAGVNARVLDSAGEPVSGSWINVEVAGASDGTWSRIKANGNSDTDGRFSASGLQPGEYILRVTRVEFAQYVSPPFRLGDGETKDLGDIRLSRGAVLEGIVRDDAGSPIEKVTVSLRDLSGREVFLFSMATTGSDGRYALHSVEPGRYTVRFETSGHAPAEKTVEITGSGGSADAVLTRGGTFQVTVKDPAGAPIADARVRLIDDKGREVSRTVSMVNFDTGRRFTDAEGVASLADLATGRYVVQVEKEGFVTVGSDARVTLEPGNVTSITVRLEPAP